MDPSQKKEVITLATDHKARDEGYEWAVMVDIKNPVANFHKRIPDMAYSVSHRGQGLQPLIGQSHYGRLS